MNMGEGKTAEFPVIERRDYSSHAIAKRIYEENRIANIRGSLCIYKKEYNYWECLKSGNYDRKIRRLLPEEDKPRCNRSCINEIINWLDTWAEAEPIIIDEAERNCYLNFRNGCINVVTKERKKKTPEYYFMHYIDIDIPPEDASWSNEEIENAAYTQFIKRTFSGKYECLRDDFEELLGLILSNQRSLKLASIFRGCPNSGKSVALNLFRSLFDKKFVSSISFSQFSEEFAVANLEGKALNISGEISGIREKRIDLFNSIVGNDTVMACFKGKDHFELNNRAFLAFACNELPVIPPEFVEAFSTRIVIFPFVNSIPREEWDPELNSKFMNEFELIGAMGIMGLARFILNGNRFTHQETLDAIKEKLLFNLNSFKAFADKRIVVDRKGFVSSSDLEMAYKEFCDEYDLNMYPSQKWSTYLREMYMEIQKTTKKDKDGKQKRGYQGIRLLPWNDD